MKVVAAKLTAVAFALACMDAHAIYKCTDAQGKTHAQGLLEMEVEVPDELLAGLRI